MEKSFELYTIKIVVVVNYVKYFILPIKCFLI